MFRYIPSQWFQYQRVRGALQFCQPDGLLFTPRQRKILIVEFKYKHTAKAYEQIQTKYVPVLQWMFRDWQIAACEVVKWYDPATPFPVPVSLKKDIEETRPGEFGVHIWKG